MNADGSQLLISTDFGKNADVNTHLFCGETTVLLYISRNKNAPKSPDNPLGAFEMNRLTKWRRAAN